jgi:hypothetical protein
VWVPTVFTKNRDRLLAADVARKFLAELMHHKELRGLLSDEHFSVDGTQIAAWASMKSFKAKDGSGDPPGPGRNGERISMARSAATPRMPRPRIRMRSFIARGAARKPSSASWATR